MRFEGRQDSGDGPVADGKMLGFGFVQLESITAANRALTEMNSTQIHGKIHRLNRRTHFCLL